MGLIRVDYSNARIQAKKLQAVASDCDEIVRQLNGINSNMPACWEGASADAFVLTVQARIREIKKIGNDAASAATQIIRVVEDLEAAERRIQAEIATAIEPIKKVVSRDV